MKWNQAGTHEATPCNATNRAAHSFGLWPLFAALVVACTGTEGSVTSNASVAIATVPHDVSITIDGRPVPLSGATSPYLLQGLRPGQHELRVERHGYEKWSATITVPESGTLNVRAVLATDKATSKDPTVAAAREAEVLDKLRDWSVGPAKLGRSLPNIARVCGNRGGSWSRTRDDEYECLMGADTFRVKAFEGAPVWLAGDYKTAPPSHTLPDLFDKERQALVEAFGPPTAGDGATDLTWQVTDAAQVQLSILRQSQVAIAVGFTRRSPASPLLPPQDSVEPGSSQGNGESHAISEAGAWDFRIAAIDPNTVGTVHTCLLQSVVLHARDRGSYRHSPSGRAYVGTVSCEISEHDNDPFEFGLLDVWMTQDEARNSLNWKGRDRISVRIVRSGRDVEGVLDHSRQDR